MVRRKRHLTLLRREAELETSSGSTPATELERKRKAERLRRALESLPDRDRDIVLLWDAGLSYDEVAAQTGLARGAVGTTLARAKRKLIDAYEGLESEDAALG